MADEVGCGYCRDWQNRNFGHLEYVVEDADGIWLLRCPRCGTLYKDDGREDPTPVSLFEAQARWNHESLGNPDGPP